MVLSISAVPTGLVHRLRPHSLITTPSVNAGTAGISVSGLWLGSRALLKPLQIDRKAGILCNTIMTSTDHVFVMPALDFSVAIRKSKPASVIVIAGRNIHPGRRLAGIANKPAVVDAPGIFVQGHKEPRRTWVDEVNLLSIDAVGGTPDIVRV